MNGQCHAIHQAVGDLDRVDGERTDLEALVGLNLSQVGIVKQAVLVQFVFHVGKGELGAPDRHVKLGENPRQSADVVLVAVGENDAANLVAILGEVGNIGHNDVDAKQFGFREHEAGVDDDNVVLPAHGHAVHSELA